VAVVAELHFLMLRFSSGNAGIGAGGGGGRTGDKDAGDVTGDGMGLAAKNCCLRGLINFFSATCLFLFFLSLRRRAARSSRFLRRASSRALRAVSPGSSSAFSPGSGGELQELVGEQQYAQGQHWRSGRGCRM